MKILFKYLLLQSIFISSNTSVNSMEESQCSLPVNTENFSFIHCYMYSNCNNNSNTMNSNSNEGNNIYKPSIMNFIQNEYKDNIEIIDEQRYIKLPIQELCKHLNIYDKYNVMKKRINTFYYNLKEISQKIEFLEIELKKNKDINKINNDYLKKYIKNSLQNTIDYQTNLVKFVNSIIEKLNNLNKSSSENNIEKNIDNYLKIVNKLLTYDLNNTKNLYENCVDKFRREIDLSMSDNNEYKLKNKSQYNKLLLNTFHSAHNNVITLLNRNLKNINNKITNIENNIIQDMQNNNYFIFTVDKYNVRKNYLLDEINSLISNKMNCYNTNFDFIISIPFDSDINSCKEIVLNKLKLYEKRLTNDAIIKLNYILQKEIIFKSSNEKIISETNNKINEIRKINNTYQ